MKEFVKKLIGRLEEEESKYKKGAESLFCEEDYIDNCIKRSQKKAYDTFVIAFSEAIEIVNQLAEEYKHGHFGCNSNGEHEKCEGCGLSGKCSHYNTEWFGVKEEYKSNLSENLTSSETSITNADKIRAMDDSELAGWISNLVRWSEDGEAILSIWDASTKSETRIHDSCGDVLEWLQSEAE